MEVLENFSLLPYNTFHIDSTTSHWISASNLDDLREGLIYSRDKDLFVLGGGSNILLLGNWAGLTLHVNLKGIELVKEDENFFYVKAQAGENWHQFVMHCLEKDYYGIENLSLIPGNVGASPMQNIGAYGVEIKDVFHELEALNKETLKVETFKLDDCLFDYRSSVFKTKAKDQYIILNVTYRLRKEPELNTTYGAIESELERMKVINPSPTDVSRAVIKIRSSKLPNPEEIGNAGSFFKNPVVSKSQFESIYKEHPDMPYYEQASGQVKLAAGWLIDKSGWKGKEFGNCGVHKHQALVLVNLGKSSGQEIYDLSEQILEDIKKRFEIKLEREVNVISN